MFHVVFCVAYSIDHSKCKLEQIDKLGWRAHFSCMNVLLAYGFYSEGFPLGAWDRLCRLIVALPGSYI